MRSSGKAAATVWAEALEASDGLEEVAARLRGPLAAALRGGVLDVLQGRAVGHSIHPVIVQVPIGALTSALVLDLLGRGESERESRQLVALACLGVVPSVLSGLAEWVDADARSQRVGLAHAAVNAASTVAAVASLLARRRPGSKSGVALSGLAALGYGVGGFLGGHLSLVRKYATHDAPSDAHGASRGVRR